MNIVGQLRDLKEQRRQSLGPHELLEVAKIVRRAMDDLDYLRELPDVVLLSILYLAAETLTHAHLEQNADSN